MRLVKKTLREIRSWLLFDLIGSVITWGLTTLLWERVLGPPKPPANTILFWTFLGLFGSTVILQVFIALLGALAIWSYSLRYTATFWEVEEAIMDLRLLHEPNYNRWSPADFYDWYIPKSITRKALRESTAWKNLTRGH